MSTYGPVTYQSNLPALGRTILAYAEVSKKELPQVLEDQASKLSFFAGVEGAQGLFQESAKTTPSEESLQALPQRQNWRIQRTDKKTGVVRPIYTEGYYRITYKRGKRAGERLIDKRTGKYRGVLVGVEGVIPRRIRARFYQASGWLSSRLGRNGGAGAAAAVGQKPNRAMVELVLDGDVLSVSITNTSEAALEVAERTGYLTRAVVNRIQNMEEYLVRKWAELAEKINNLHLPSPQ